jgi:hypothetical protein
MKKVLFTATVLAFGLTSCEKECSSTCGTIANDGIDGSCYWLEIRNDCSDNKKKFCVDEDVWMESYVGTNFCVSNTSPW